MKGTIKHFFEYLMLYLTKAKFMSASTLEILKSFEGQAMDKSPSPFGRWLKGVLLKVDKGEVTCSFEVRDEMCNPLGLLHGGVAASIADEVIGIAGATLDLPGRYVSINLTTDFMDSAKSGDLIHATATIDRAGKTLIHGTCKISHPERQKVLAFSTSNLVALRT